MSYILSYHISYHIIYLILSHHIISYAVISFHITSYHITSHHFYSPVYCLLKWPSSLLPPLFSPLLSSEYNVNIHVRFYLYYSTLFLFYFFFFFICCIVYCIEWDGDYPLFWCTFLVDGGKEKKEKKRKKRKERCTYCTYVQCASNVYIWGVVVSKCGWRIRLFNRKSLFILIFILVHVHVLVHAFLLINGRWNPPLLFSSLLFPSLFFFLYSVLFSLVSVQFQPLKKPHKLSRSTKFQN